MEWEAQDINERENAVDMARMMDDPKYQEMLDGIVIDESVGIFAPDVDFSTIPFVRITSDMLTREEVAF